MARSRITVEDCRALGYCTRGVRQFCQESGIDFRDFVKNGFDLDAARALSDGRVNRLIERVEGQR